MIEPKYKKDGYIRFLAMERENAFRDLYFGGDESLKKSMYNSPLYAPEEILEKQPRTLVISASTCNFRFEDEEYGVLLSHNGVETTIIRIAETAHGFIPHFRPGWETAADLICEAILEN